VEEVKWLLSENILSSVSKHPISMCLSMTLQWHLLWSKAGGLSHLVDSLSLWISWLIIQSDPFSLVLFQQNYCCWIHYLAFYVHLLQGKRMARNCTQKWRGKHPQTADSQLDPRSWGTLVRHIQRWSDIFQSEDIFNLVSEHL